MGPVTPPVRSKPRDEHPRTAVPMANRRAEWGSRAQRVLDVGSRAESLTIGQLRARRVGDEPETAPLIPVAAVLTD
jgi:hypothetical protein